MLRAVDQYLLTDVLGRPAAPIFSGQEMGQPVSPSFKGQEVQELLDP